MPVPEIREVACPNCPAQFRYTIEIHGGFKQLPTGNGFDCNLCGARISEIERVVKIFWRANPYDPWQERPF